MYDFKADLEFKQCLFEIESAIVQIAREKNLDFKEQMNLAATMLQYVAAGNDPTAPINFEKPFPVNLIPAPNFGPNKTLCVSPELKQYFLRVQIPEGTAPMKFFSCYRHNPPCGKKMRRPHSICTHCLYVKRQRGFIPEYVPVKLIIWALRRGARWQNTRDVIVKKLQELLEFISDF